jgi:phospholipase/carboxylesterase
MMALFAGLRRPQGRPAPRAILAYAGALLAPASLPAERSGHPPVLLVHGEDDDVVPATRSRDAETALSESAVPVQAHYLPRLGHWLDEPGLALGALALQRGFS